MNIGKPEELRKIISKLRITDRRTYILMTPNSIGEIATISAFSKSFKIAHGVGITLVCRQNHVVIPNIFYANHFERIIVMPMSLMHDFSLFRVIDPLNFDLDVPINMWPGLHGDGRLLEIHDLKSYKGGRGGLSYIDMHRYMLRIGWDAKIEKFNIPAQLEYDAKKYAENIGIVPGMSVILFIGNNSNSPAPSAVFVQIAKEYCNKGYKVFFNKKGAMHINDDSDIKLYANEIDLNIEMAISVANIAGNVVMSSNGLTLLFLLLFNMNFNLFVLLTDGISSDGGHTYRTINFLMGSHYLVSPELVFNKDNYREFIVERNISDDDINNLSSAIVNRHEFKNEVTSSNINNHISTYSFSNWDDLVY